MKIVADQHIPFVEHYFGHLGELVLKPGRQIEHRDLLAADILLVRSITKVNAVLLQDTAVKWVGSVTTGHDHLDIPWLEQHGIGWSTTAGFNATPVVEYVVCTIAALQCMGMLTQQTLQACVIGVGKIGQQVADVLNMLGWKVIFCDPLRAAQESSFVSIALEECADMDLITLHTPLTHTGQHSTFHLIDHAFLQRQKAQAVLLNTGRGAVVDSAALKKYGRFMQVCLDVWEHEPRIDRDSLQEATIATPHIAGYSVQARYRGVAMIYQAAQRAGMIDETTAALPLPPPVQTCVFSGATRTWQEVVLTLFNPWLTTQVMKTALLSDDQGGVFDQLRKEFKDRHEFASVSLADVVLAEQDRRVLTALGFNITG
ncbi:MAG: hypothetical protein A3E83_04850 [Gammaproteobacteria bacterium RIFCSPHIGHO2_12_FULL_41_20]|nr:MAG: hypothetical protein A3E83_04850 [Gammaproteobacteria bacterium RIFCSPHIGHO2_12_FULL_41_20]